MDELQQLILLAVRAEPQSEEFFSLADEIITICIEHDLTLLDFGILGGLEGCSEY